MGSAPLLSAAEKESFQSTSNLPDAVGCIHVSTALYVPSHFPCCLSNQIRLLPDVSHLAESVAHAAVRFSQGFKHFTKSSKKFDKTLNSSAVADRMLSFNKRNGKVLVQLTPMMHGKLRNRQAGRGVMAPSGDLGC